MKRKILLFVCVILAAISIMAVGVCAAETYTPDEYGQYTVTLSQQAHNSYMLFAIKGEYDQTNYIEAFNSAADDDIIYFDQKTSDADGNVTFGPFVPMGYYNATLIVGGIGYDEPVLAGYLSAKGIYNAASVKLSGLKAAYTVEGMDGEDISAEITAEVFDSFGYPCMTGEKATLSLSENADGVTLNGNTLVISKTAKAQTFSVTAEVGDVTKTEFVTVSRNPSVRTYIEVYNGDASVESVTVTGVVGAYPSVTLTAKTFDQYGEEIEDSYTYLFDGLTSTATVTPKRTGSTIFVVKSSNASIEKSVEIIANSRPDYAGTALNLYNLIGECEAELSLLGSEKFVSSESGKDVYPEDKWTTSAKADALKTAIDTAKAALANYGTDGYGDGDYSDEITALDKALDVYLDSFKSGIREDVASISMDETSLRLPVSSNKVELSVTTVPAIKTTTDKITWTSSDDAVATVNQNGEVVAKASGVVTITATTRAGLTAELQLTVFKPANIKMELTPSKLTSTYGSEAAVFTASAYPADNTDTFTWTVEKPELATLIVSEDGLTATVVPKAAGKTDVTVTSDGGNKSATSTLTVVMPAWDKASAPAASAESGEILVNTAVKLTCETANTTIYYTLDGTEPSRTNGRVYKNPVVISQDLTLKAIAVGNNLYDSDVVTYEYEVVAATISAESVLGKAGETVYVDVTYSDIMNVSDLSYTITYDENALTYKNVIVGEGSFDGIGTTDNGSYVFNGNTAGKVDVKIENADYTFEGVAFTLVLEINENAAEGDYELSFTNVSAKQVSGASLSVAVNDGNVKVYNYVVGDTDGNGKINLYDVILLKQYVAGNEDAVEKVILQTADCDADGDVDNDDVALLSKYCVGWDVTLG